MPNEFVLQFTSATPFRTVDGIPNAIWTYTLSWSEPGSLRAILGISDTHMGLEFSRRIKIQDPAKFPDIQLIQATKVEKPAQGDVQYIDVQYIDRVPGNSGQSSGADLYVANRGNGTIGRLRQDGTVVAVRQVALPGRGALGADRLNGIAVSPDALRLWVTVSGVVPEFPQAEGFVLELPAFGAPVVGRK